MEARESETVTGYVWKRVVGKWKEERFTFIEALPGYAVELEKRKAVFQYLIHVEAAIPNLDLSLREHNGRLTLWLK